MFEFHWYTAIPWCLSLLMFVERIVSQKRGAGAAEKERRRLLDATVETRLQKLETTQLVEQTKLDGDIKLMNQKIDGATAAMSQAKTLIKSALDHV